ncbi:hypothetical protein B6U80_00310 [Candidatus Pacearchaeota archaeon ex4484_26]|nr:MAG: hypothetical protein B6U80_00310 [Candidatus Pacearchaeota archaeon ex4484_26]
MKVITEYKEVPKVWGKEIWLVNRDYCGKILVLKKGHRCSLHFHKQKDETFYLLRGKVLMELDKEKAILKPGQSLLIKPGQKHRFTGLEDSEILEFSTHHEDSDSHRDVFGGKVDLATLNLKEDSK